MIPYTQTNLDPGNCWQTAIASILEVPVETLPDQSVCDIWEKPNPNDYTTWKRLDPCYNGELRSYLYTHHKLAYLVLSPYIQTVLQVKPPGIHLMSGETVRTPYNRTNHIVIANNGEMVWDPHPSRAGLTKVVSWGMLMPYPDDWEVARMQCHCPACGGY